MLHKNELIDNYLNFLNRKDNDELFSLYEKITGFGSKHFIPAVSFEVALFLHWIVSVAKPVNVLEIGFGAGASTIFIDKALSIDAKLTTLERDHNRVARGVNLLNELGIKRINLIHVDAFVFLEDKKNEYDFVFLDAVKKDYKEYLKKINNLMKPGGLLVCDNIFFNKRVVEENVEKKYLNGVNSMKQFNDNLSSNPGFITFFADIGDGLSLSIKK